VAGPAGKETGEEKEKGKKKLTCGPRVSERKGRAGERERTWAGPAERERRKRDRERSSDWPRGEEVEEREPGREREWAGVAHTERRKKGREGRGGFGLAARLFPFSFSSLSFFSILKLFKHTI
jgi:hypothetical protein